MSENFYLYDDRSLFCILAILQFVSWIGFGAATIWGIHKVLFDRKDECYE